MTQLNLSGRQSSNTKQNPNAEPEDGSVKNQTVGALGALAMFAVVIVIGSCSRSNKPVAVQEPIQPTAPVSTPAVTSPAPAPVQAKAKTKKRRATTYSYVNREYGVAFSFPRQYMLKSGDDAQLSWGDMGPFQMDFVQPGGMTLAAVQLPKNSYPGTDFKSAFINLSVNPGMTSEACTQFAFPEAKSGAEVSSPHTGEETAGRETTGEESKAANNPARSEVEGSVHATDAATKIKIGATEFSEVENLTAATMKQADSKYYHTFNNGTCYEFALGLGTESDGSVEGISPVDRQAVFGKLEKILATVKLQGVAAPAETPSPSAKDVVPGGNSKTQEQSAIDRKF